MSDYVTPERNRQAREQNKAMWARARASSAPVQNTAPAPTPNPLLVLGAPSQPVAGVPEWAQPQASRPVEAPVTETPLTRPVVNWRKGDAAPPAASKPEGETPRVRRSAFKKPGGIVTNSGDETPLQRLGFHSKRGA